MFLLFLGGFGESLSLGKFQDFLPEGSMEGGGKGPCALSLEKESA